MDWIEDLEKILPRNGNHDPEQRAAATDWHPVEQRAGNHIPQDFKLFDAHWGHGVLGGFVNFFSPTSQYPALDYDWGIQNFVQSYRSQKNDYPNEFPLSVLPVEGSLLPFAITDNGDWLGWILSGKSDDWIVAVIGSDVGEPEQFGMPFRSFVEGLARGNFAPNSFPRSHQSQPMDFRLLTR